jgi:molybdenum cofactor synthesis domain-containing protein
MAQQSRYPEISVDDALAQALAAVAPLPAVSRAFDSALGLVLAADISATEAMPPFAASAKDGYALRSADGVQPRRLLGEATAGRGADLTVEPGTACRITTGAPVPTGADTVVMVEQADEADGFVTPRLEVTAGADIRPAGQDYAAGDLVLAAGTRVGPAELGLLASLGALTVSVHPAPRVAVFSTGDELVAPGDQPAPGQIRDANRFALAAAARQAGADVVTVDSLRDRPGDLEKLEAATRSHDVVITSGGVSMGRLDLVKPWLEAQGTVLFGRVRTRPGKPMTLGLVGGTPVFALPGFPVSSLVSFELFVRPALLRMAGHREVLRPRWLVQTGHDLHHASDRTEFQRALVVLDDGSPVAHSTGSQGSGRLLSFHGANALLALPAGSGFTPAGAWVAALMLDLPRPAPIGAA